MAEALYREIYDHLLTQGSGCTLHAVAEALTSGDVFDAKAALDHLVGLDLIDSEEIRHPEGRKRLWFVKDIK